MSWPRAVLLSLSNKAGAAPFAAALAAHGARLIASGGTSRHLVESGLEVTSVESWTGSPELLGGRVKTLHPNVHASILARRSVATDVAALAERGLEPVDLVAVTLYPFEERASRLEEGDAVEEIDIGGVALLRAAAKNFRDVIVVHDPSQYDEVLKAIEAGGPTLAERRAWATRTFARTARYDAAIASELERRVEEHGSKGGSPRGENGEAREALPPSLYFLSLERIRTLRYGENPHQPGALYARPGDAARLTSWREGKELSYNNLVDIEAAFALALRFADPACVIVKHGEPCGAACASSLTVAYEAALRSDELSAYGGVVAFNRPLDGATATRLAGQFVECVAAPELSAEAVDVFKSKKNLRAVQLAAQDLQSPDPWKLRLLGRWALLQRDAAPTTDRWATVTSRAPTPEERSGLEFAWEIAAAARSNAIAIARGSHLVALGSGQASRVDALDVALMKARRAGHELKGAVLASDGFLPFADTVEHAARAGLAAIVQPGGSVRDSEVVAACDREGVAMIFTGQRTFRH